MAISSLIVGGTAGGNRPPVGTFFGKSSSANDNAQKVSSDFISKDILGSVLGSISGISAELNKIQQFSKDVIKGFERLVVDMRKLNNDITSKFKSVNAQMKKDNMEFLRSITRSYATGEALQPVGETAPAGAPAAASTTGPEKKSFLDSMLDLANLADTAKDVFDLAKKYGPRVMQGARAFAGSAALPITAVAGGMIALGYHRKQAQEANPLGAENFDRSISSGAKRAEVIQGPEADKNAPNANADISRQKLSPPDFLMREGIIQKPSEAKNVIANIKGDIITLKDGRYFDNKEQILRNPDGSPAEKGPTGKPTNAAAANVQGSQQSFRVGGEEAKEGSPLSEKQMIAVNMALSMNPENANQYPSWLMDQYNKQKSGGQATTGSAPTGSTTTTTPEAPSASSATPAQAPAAETGAPMKVADIPPSAAPADVPSEGNTPAAKEAGAPAPAAAPVPAAAAPGSPSKIDEEDFSNLANVSGVQVEKGKDLPPTALAALDAMVANDPEATARKYPAWVLEQYAKQNGQGSPAGGAGDQTTPELGGGAGGTPGAEGGTTAGGGSTGGPEGEAGAPAGAPEAAPAAPPSVPSDLVPPSQEAQDNKPIVMNNESSSSSGSVTAGEADNISGQNLPMTAQNEALTEYFAKQNIDYQ